SRGRDARGLLEVDVDRLVAHAVDLELDLDVVMVLLRVLPCEDRDVVARAETAEVGAALVRLEQSIAPSRAGRRSGRPAGQRRWGRARSVRAHRDDRAASERD